MRVEPIDRPKSALSGQAQSCPPNGQVCDDQEFARLSDRVQELDRVKQQQQRAFDDAQRKLKCAEWEHAMSESARQWYHLRCEEAKAAQSVEEALAHHQQLKLALKRAEESAQQLHQQKPDC